MVEGVYQNLGRKTFWIFIIKRSTVIFVFLFLTVALIVIRYFVVIDILVSFMNFFDLAILISFILILLAALLVVPVAYLEYIRFKIMLGPDTFQIVRGILTKKETSLPYRRIEGVDIKQTLLYQIFGVSHLTIERTIENEKISSPDNDPLDEILPVIDSQLAIEIQKELTTRANVLKFSNK